MADGDDCKCCACCISYCSCGADWTSQEVYDLRNKVSQLQAEVARLTDENAALIEQLRWRIWPDEKPESSDLLLVAFLSEAGGAAVMQYAGILSG